VVQKVIGVNIMVKGEFGSLSVTSFSAGSFQSKVLSEERGLGNRGSSPFRRGETIMRGRIPRGMKTDDVTQGNKRQPHKGASEGIL